MSPEEREGLGKKLKKEKVDTSTTDSAAIAGSSKTPLKEGGKSESKTPSTDTTQVRIYGITCPAHHLSNSQNSTTAPKLKPKTSVSKLILGYNISLLCVIGKASPSLLSLLQTI